MTPPPAPTCSFDGDEPAGFGFDEPGSGGVGFGGFGSAGFETGSSAGATVVRPQVRPLSEAEREQPVPWHVVLLDDDDHTYEYVIRMLMELFGHSMERAFQIAKRVDQDGRAVCTTTHRELAELKAEQVLGYGADPLSASSVGSMSAIIEPADCGSDDDELSSGHGSIEAN